MDWCWMFFDEHPDITLPGSPTQTNLRFPTPAGSVALGSLRSPSLNLPRWGWDRTEGKQITESSLHGHRRFERHHRHAFLEPCQRDKQHSYRSVATDVRSSAQPGRFR